jgi:hypothetical protein
MLLPAEELADPATSQLGQDASALPSVLRGSSGREPSGKMAPPALQGTTTNGGYLLPFRTGAFVAGAPVQPVLLQYRRRADAPQLSWETIEAPRHVLLVFATLLHRARIVELPVYEPDQAERVDAALYARNVRAYMVRRPDSACLLLFVVTEQRGGRRRRGALRAQRGAPPVSHVRVALVDTIWRGEARGPGAVHGICILFS